MNLSQRVRMSSATQCRRQFNVEGTLLHLFEQTENQAPQETLRNAFRCRINRSDTAEIWELLTIFVPTRVMRQQISGGMNSQSPQSHHTRPWNPTELRQQLIDVHQSNGAALRSACTWS